MSSKVHPSIITINPKELREIQKIHELGRKYWPKVDLLRYEEEEKKTDVQRWRYYLRHPWLRICTAYLVVFCNFLIFAEDPVSHSYTECTIDYIGDVYTFVFARYPTGSFVLVKLGTWLFAVGLGMLIGKYIVHKWLFCHKFKLKIFTEDGQGSWMIMFLTCLMSLYIFSFAYNGFLMLEGKYMDKLHASSRMSMENQSFMKLAAMGTWMGDFITAWMVTDMMLQGLKYPDWGQAVRAVWNKGLNRVYAFWFVALTMTIVVSTAISTDYLDWDRISRDFMPTNELSRALLTSFILVMDLLIVMQDWEFPHFSGALDVKLPGVNTDSVEFRLPGCCGSDAFDVYITGKWFNYGIIFMVMILDLNMWKNQIFYDPLTYGQYTDKGGYIYTVSDKQFLRWANDSMMTYEWRWNHMNPKTNRTFGSDDHRMNSRYKGYSLGLKGLAFVPSLVTFCLFGYLLWLLGQEENGDEVLIRRYRCNARRERQLKRIRRKKRRQAKLKRKTAKEEGVNMNQSSLDLPDDGCTPDPSQLPKPEILDPFLLEDDEEPQEVQTKEEEKEVKQTQNQFKYYLRHPYLRIVTAYLVVFCNFLIFAEDPVSHSYTDCIIDIIGNIYAFIMARYPPHAGFVVLKVFMFIVSVITGMIVGKFFVHKFLFCRVFKLKLFSEEGQGSWMVMFLMVLVFTFNWSFCYNEFLLLGGPQYIPYKVSSNMGIENQNFMKVAAMGTWFGDFITAWMVTDMMLQETQYEWWSPRLRVWWRHGMNRVYAFWGVAVFMTIVVCTAITTDYLDWDRISNDFMPTNEVSRAFLASFILVMDLLIVMQDWEFPYFAGGMDIKLPGINTGDVSFKLPGGEVHITGKWFNYGIIFIVMILDLNMWKNQIFYDPYVYGQYTDKNDYIYTVSDKAWLKNATRETLTYVWRWNNTDPLTSTFYGLQDHRMNSKYLNYPLSVKGIAFGPSITAFVVFGYLAKRFSREEAEEKMTKVDDLQPVKSEEDWDLPDESDEEDGDISRSAALGRRGRQELNGAVLNAMRNTRGDTTGDRGPNNGEAIEDSLRDEDLPNVCLGGERSKTMVDIVMMKRASKRWHHRAVARRTLSTLSIGSSQDSPASSTEDVRNARDRHVISPLSLDSSHSDVRGSIGDVTRAVRGKHDEQASSSFFSASDLVASSRHVTASNDILRSPAALDSGEESDPPKELSFSELQKDNSKNRENAQKNWDKLKRHKELSIGDLFRVEPKKSGSHISEGSLHTSSDEETTARELSGGVSPITHARQSREWPKPSAINLLQVPRKKGRTVKSGP